MNQDGTIVFLRDDILTSLELDNVPRSQVLSLKYYDDLIKSWREVPEQIFITIQEANPCPNSIQIVELLIRETPKD